MADLSTIPTQDLLDEFMRRAERGEVMAPILHWIGNMAALALVEEHARSANTPAQKQWLLNRIVYALTGPDYDKWVAEYQQTIADWGLGEEPSPADRARCLSVPELWEALSPDERDAVLGALGSDEVLKSLGERGLLTRQADSMCWTPQAYNLRRYAMSLPKK